MWMLEEGCNSFREVFKQTPSLHENADDDVKCTGGLPGLFLQDTGILGGVGGEEGINS